MLISRGIYDRYCAVVDTNTKIAAAKNDRQEQWSKAKKWAAAALKAINEKDDWRVSFPKFLKELFAKTAEQRRIAARVRRNEKLAGQVIGNPTGNGLFDTTVINPDEIDVAPKDTRPVTANIPGVQATYANYGLGMQNRKWNPFTWRWLNESFAKSQDGVAKQEASIVGKKLYPHTKKFISDVQNAKNNHWQWDVAHPTVNQHEGYTDRYGNQPSDVNDGKLFTRVNVKRLLKSDVSNSELNELAGHIYHEGTHTLDPSLIVEGPIERTLLGGRANRATTPEGQDEVRRESVRAEAFARMGEIRGLSEIDGLDRDKDYAQYPLSYQPSHTSDDLKRLRDYIHRGAENYSVPIPEPANTFPSDDRFTRQTPLFNSRNPYEDHVNLNKVWPNKKPPVSSGGPQLPPLQDKK